MESHIYSELEASVDRTDQIQRVASDVGSILLSRGIPFRGWSGMQAAVIGGHRVSQDADLWLPDRAIFPAYEYLSRESAFPIELEDLDDRTIIAVGEEREVELMANMDIHTTDGVYPMRLSKHVLRQSTPPQKYGTLNMLPMAPPEDTMLLKAILQRDERVGKHDGEDIRAMVAAMRWVNQPYLLRRMQATRSADRAIPFLQANGLKIDNAHVTPFTGAQVVPVHDA